MNNKIVLEDGGNYKNRIGEIVTVFKFGGDIDFPFVDVLGRSYNENGKLWEHRESNYDLIEYITNKKYVNND